MSVHVDANILIDVLSDDPVWADWSLDALTRNALHGIACSLVVYAEASVEFETQEDLDHWFDGLGLEVMNMPRAALFLAAKVHILYRRRGGLKTSTLPDFLIGAHARVAGATLLTRDPARFRSYFPDVELISP